MKQIISLVILTALTFATRAQLSPDQQKQADDAKKKMEQMQNDPAVRQKMQMAQHLMDSLKNDPKIQQALKQANTQLNKVKQDHPEAAGIELPDLNKAHVVSLDSVNQQLSKSTQMMSAYSGAFNQTAPKENLLLHAEKLPPLSAAALQALVSTVLKNAMAKMDPFRVAALKKKLDTCRNLAGLGAFLLANDASVNQTLYIICKAILKNPKDIWSVNNFAVFYRNQMQYEPALRCFLYANNLDSGRSSVLAVNIGWAALYYGDFGTAGKYFDKAQAIDGDFNSALEGKALMAYQRGDIQALFKCLTKEVEIMMKNVKGYKPGSGGDASLQEPSDPFTDLCTAAYLQSVLNFETQPDPTRDHSLDNLAQGDDDQGTPPGAEEDDVTFQQYKRIFIGSIGDLNMTKPECVKFQQSAAAQLNSMHKAFNQQMHGLTPLVTTVESDGKGNIIVSKNFRRYVNLFTEATKLFERRAYWFSKQYRKDFQPWPARMLNRNIDLQNQYVRELEGCPPSGAAHDACVNRVDCEWIPRMTTEGNSNLEGLARIWNSYWNNLYQTIQWYINVTGPLISRVHDAGWNSYLNNERLVYVRTAVLSSYFDWADALIVTPVPMLVGRAVPSCPININGMDPPDPFSQKPKHIREFQGPCYDQDYQMGPGGIQETCHSTKYYLGYGDSKLFWEKVKDPLYASDNNYSNKVGGTIGVSKMMGVEQESEGSGLKFAAGLNVKAEATLWGQWNDKGQFTGAGSGVAASVEADAEVSKGNFKLGGSQALGVDARNTYKIVAGQLQTGPPVITVTH